MNSDWSDRLLGLVCLVIAVLYTVEARTFEGTAFGSGPVGPKTLPTGVGILFGALSLYLIARPDPPPAWPSRNAWWQIGLVLVSSYIYGQVLGSVGFIVASAAMMMIMGVLFKAPPRLLMPLSVLFPTALAFVFNNWLELRLPSGLWGGF
ncbi:MAG: tripartite tricarboxylate transporter TctB family protein [Acidimicrobiales bacterium]